MITEDGALINHQTNSGATPLLIAAQQGETQENLLFIQFLLKHDDIDSELLTPKGASFRY